MSIKTIKPSEKVQTKQDHKVLGVNNAERSSSNRKIVRRGSYVKATGIGTGIIEEKVASRMEKRIPRLAEAAMGKAYRRALASGSKVLIAEAGELKEVSPDGTKQVIKRIEPPVKMQKGQIIKIK